MIHQDEIKLYRLKLEKQIKETEQRASNRVANIKDLLKQLKVDCKHPNMDRGCGGDRIIVDCPDCLFSDVY